MKSCQTYLHSLLVPVARRLTVGLRTTELKETLDNYQPQGCQVLLLSITCVLMTCNIPVIDLCSDASHTPTLIIPHYSVRILLK